MANVKNKRNTSHILKRRKPFYDKPLWVVCSGSWETKIKKAKYYLARKAFIPLNPKGEPGIIFVIMANLRLYYCLSLELSIALINEKYLPRLREVTGRVSNWSDAALRKKGAAVTKRKVYPTLGIADQRAVDLRKTRELEKSVEEFLLKQTQADGKCDTRTLREAFIAYSGMTDVSPQAFGKVVVTLTGIDSKSSFGRRHYPGFHIVDTDTRLNRNGKTAQVQLAS